MDTAPGLCGRCEHVRTVASGKGSVFFRCARHDDDPAFPKYPRLPVLRCTGFEARALPVEIPLASPAAPAAPPPRVRAARQANLLDRVGGREMVRRVVAEFYDRVEADAELRAVFPESLDHGREKQALFLEQWMGGEPVYSALYGHPRLRMRHFPFVIDQRAAGLWLRHFGEALRAAGVDEPEIAEVLAALGPMARHMVNADQDVPREPIGDAFLT
ncbi:MAG: hypothetical protein O2798_11575 [Chloroflexi bacterium]|nr:hypothetical protein [Chloroflexota bacterium]MDA1241461.1 hypothetical protein [Chloroflexota bacterium]